MNSRLPLNGEGDVFVPGEGDPLMAPSDRSHRGTELGGVDKAPHREMIRAPVTPSLIAWARKRAGWELADLVHRFPKLRAWEAGEIKPPLEQAKAFAHTVHVPFGYLFLSVPPEEPIPIPDSRTMVGKSGRRASPSLLDMIYVTQRRQDWYRELALKKETPKVHFVGSLTIDTPVPAAAAAIARELNFNIDARADCRTWEEVLRLLIDRADQAGVLVMVSVVVLNNTHRRLDPAEFRGFALADDHAPLVFINGADIKAGLMFTLAHELAHLWLGVSALSDDSPATIESDRCKKEAWCNQVAAELLVPLDEFRAALDEAPTGYIPGEAQGTVLQKLSRRFKVSTLVILRRLLDAGALDRTKFDAAWEFEFGHLMEFECEKHEKADGSNFYHTKLLRVGRRFARALVESTLKGETLYCDAFQMLGVVKAESFNDIGRRVGVIPWPGQ